jgi:hypothetical protein
MLDSGLGYAGIGIRICWNWDNDMLELGLGYAGIGIRICWDLN